MEKWVKIKGFLKYEISSLGRLKTFNWKGSGQERIMKPAHDAKGYLRTVLVSDEGKNKTVKLHRLVALNFIENPLGKPQVNHINGIKDDNRVENLEWMTGAENSRHSIDNGLQISFKGSKVGTSKLTEEQVLKIREEYIPTVVTRKMLAEKYGVAEATIKNILYRRTWRHI